MIKPGGNSISRIKKGTTEISKVYIGTNLIWPPFSSDQLSNYFLAAGFTNDSDVLYQGTPQEKTVGQIKAIITTLANRLSSAGLLAGENAFDAFYPIIGETVAACKVNFINPQQYNLSFPNGIGINSYGIYSDVSDQYGATGIHPFPDLYPDLGGGSNLLTYSSERASGYLAMFVSGNSADLGCVDPANNGYNQERWYLYTRPSGWSQGYYAFGASNGWGVESSGNVTSTGFLEGNRLDRSLITIKSTDQSGVAILKASNGPTSQMAYYPNEEMTVSGTSPVSFVFIRRKGLTSTEETALRAAVIEALNNLGRFTASNVSKLAPPSSLSVDNTLKMITFTPAQTSPWPSHYEFSTDGGVTWTQCNDDSSSPLYNTRRNYITGGGWGSTSHDNTVSTYIGNLDLAPGAVRVRTKARTEGSASTAIASSSAFTQDQNYDRWRPGHLGMSSSTKTITWTPAPLAWIEHTGYQFTEDGGATWQPCKFMQLYSGNKNFAPGQYGIRYIDSHTGQVLSGGLFNTATFSASPVAQVTVTGLKESDSSVRATTIEGSDQVVLSNNNYNLKVGDGVIILGAGRRGARGVGGEWPHYRFASLGAANAALSASPQNYVPNQYAWVEDEGWSIRLNNQKTTWEYYHQLHPDYNKSHALPLRASVTAVSSNGLTITLSKPAKLSESNCAVYFDNADLLNIAFGSLAPGATEVTIPSGNYAIGSEIYVGNYRVGEGDQLRHGIHIKARGVTLYSPAKCVSATFKLSPTGSKINDYPGTGKFTIKGNYNYDDMGFRTLPDSPSGWTSQYLPNLDQVMQNEVAELACFEFGGGPGQKIYDIEAWDGPGSVIKLGSSGGLVKNSVIKRHNIIPLTLQGGVPYAGSYYWAFYVDGVKGGTFDTFNYESPMWLNAYEAFKSVDATFINGTVLNGHASCNGSAQALFKNINVTIQPGTKYFQNIGHSIQEMNLFMGNPEGWNKTRFENYHITIQDGANLWCPVGFMLGQTGPGAEVVNCSYTRPHFSGNPSGPGQGLRMNGQNAYINGFTATGNWRSSMTATEVGYETNSALAIIEGDDGFTGCVIQNVSVPIIYAPASPDISLQNCVATQIPLTRHPYIYIPDSTRTISGNSTTFSATIYDPGRTITRTEWRTLENPPSTITFTAGTGSNTVIATGFIPGDYLIGFQIFDDQGFNVWKYSYVKVI